MDIYAQNILDRYKSPFYKDKKVKADIQGKQVNHSCGDKVEIQIELASDKIKAYAFTGVGCAISQAAVDILGDLIVDEAMSSVKTMPKDDLLEALGIKISERRMKCALLGLNAVQDALKKNVKQITPDMTISQIIIIKPNTAKIFKEYGLHCATCSVSAIETLHEGCSGHGLSEKEIQDLTVLLNAN